VRVGGRVQHGPVDLLCSLKSTAFLDSLEITDTLTNRGGQVLPGEGGEAIAETVYARDGSSIGDVGRDSTTLSVTGKHITN
jgi:hypothetical protein